MDTMKNLLSSVFKPNIHRLVDDLIASDRMLVTVANLQLIDKIESGADIVDVNKVSQDGKTVLGKVVAEIGRVKAISGDTSSTLSMVENILLEKGANPLLPIQQGKTGTILEAAIEHKRPLVAMTMVERAAKSRPVYKAVDGRMALELLVSNFITSVGATENGEHMDAMVLVNAWMREATMGSIPDTLIDAHQAQGQLWKGAAAGVLDDLPYEKETGRAHASLHQFWMIHDAIHEHLVLNGDLVCQPDDMDLVRAAHDRGVPFYGNDGPRLLATIEQISLEASTPAISESRSRIGPRL